MYIHKYDISAVIKGMPHKTALSSWVWTVDSSRSGCELDWCHIIFKNLLILYKLDSIFVPVKCKKQEAYKCLPCICMNFALLYVDRQDLEDF